MLKQDIKLTLQQLSTGDSIFNVQILGDYSNCIALNEVSKITELSQDRPWIIILFAGWSGADLFTVNFLLDLSKDFKDISFGFKAYNDIVEIMNFSSTINELKFTPIILGLQNNTVNILSNKPLRKDEVLKMVLEFKESLKENNNKT